MIQTRTTVYLTCDLCPAELHHTGEVNAYEHIVKRDTKDMATRLHGWNFNREGRWVCRKCSGH